MEPATAARASRRRIVDARERLRRRFGPFEVVDQPWPVDARAYESYVELIERGTLGGAGAWIEDDEGRVLLLRDRGREGWSEPSGHHEPGESLPETARREVREETGLDVELDGVALFQHLRVRVEDEDLPTLHRTIVVFGAHRTGGDLSPRPGEIEAARWFESHPEPLVYDALRRLEIPYEG